MEIKANEIKIVDIDSLIPNPKNNNKHSAEQIERLTKLIKYQGFRNPVVVSNRTGFLVVGHGRIEAARKAGLKEVPAIFQDFESDAQEYSYLTSDNAIALWAEIDKDMILDEIMEFDDLDIEMLGFDDFKTIGEIEEEDLPDLGDGSDSMIKKVTFTLSTEQSDLVDDAIKKIKKESECKDEINENSNGNALAEIMRLYVC